MQVYFVYVSMFFYGVFCLGLEKNRSVRESQGCKDGFVDKIKENFYNQLWGIKVIVEGGVGDDVEKK